MSTSKIIIVGLGPGDPAQLTLGAYKTIEAASVVYLRTAKHPTVPHLPPTPQESFDDFYDKSATFGEVYDAIVAKLIELTKKSAEPIVYAVPGHPLVGESSVLRLLSRADEENIATQIVDGVSFLEPIFGALRLDPLRDGLVVLDATELAEQAEIQLPRKYGVELPVLRPLIVGQVYNQRLASAVKLALMENYPDDQPVTLLRGTGVPDEAAKLDIPLYELDRYPEWTDHLTSVYVAPREIKDATGTFANAHYVIARLRAPGGCDWDRAQTHESLKDRLIEEVYEVIEAIEHEPEKLPEELGDLLIQVLMHAGIAAENSLTGWTIADVMREMSEKLIRRHPHIFAGATEKPSWDAIKQAEKAARGDKSTSLLDNVPRHMPALQQAQALQHRAAKLGFVWRKYDEVIDKLVEEVNEVRHAATQAEKIEEIGDVLKVLVSAAAFLGIDAEDALRQSNAKFRRRFAQWEAVVKERNSNLAEMTLPQLEEIWQEAKRREKGLEARG
jgi:tetrapyrrole methylase family protein / MazG family protein